MNEIKLPRHVAIIMDGNRRWARERNMKASQGHLEGAKNLEKLAVHILKSGIQTLSVFAFSTENFKRDSDEVDYLMNLIKRFLNNNMGLIKKNKIKIIVSGRKEGLRKDILEAIENIEQETKENTKGIFNICINYGGQQEIVDASIKLAKLYKEDKIDLETIDINSFHKYLYHDLEAIDYLIRTSGEMRLSNFLMYQLAYSELYFTDKYFPEFDEKEYDIAIEEYLKRQRRFGV